MDTNHLIKKIVDEGAQKPLPHPIYQTMQWLTGILLYFVAFVGYYDIRTDIGKKLSEFIYLSELFILLSIGTVSALAAFCFSRPDAHQRPWIKTVMFSLIILWAIIAFSGASEMLTRASLLHAIMMAQFICPWHIVLFSIPPTIAIFLIVRRGATIQYFWAGSMATLSVTALGYMLLRLIEQDDNPAHLIIWHALPVLLMCLIGMLVGRLTLKWR